MRVTLNSPWVLYRDPVDVLFALRNPEKILWVSGLTRPICKQRFDLALSECLVMLKEIGKRVTQSRDFARTAGSYANLWPSVARSAANPESPRTAMSTARLSLC